ncbi:g3638 [Coccomyxa elongata]
MLEASEAPSNTSSQASENMCSNSTTEKVQEGAPGQSAGHTLVDDANLLKRISDLEEENCQLKTKKDDLAYRLIDTEDKLAQRTEQLAALQNERDEGQRCAWAWFTEISFGQGFVQGMLQSQHALQSQVMALENEVAFLTIDNAWLRFFQGPPPKRSQSSEIVPASAVQRPAGARPRPEMSFQRLSSGSSLRPAPSSLCCVEEIASSVHDPRPHHVKTTAAASGLCAAASCFVLTADCTGGLMISLNKAQEHTRTAQKTADQPQHLMARPLQPEPALGAEPVLAHPDMAGKKSGIGGCIGHALGALFDLREAIGRALGALFGLPELLTY